MAKETEAVNKQVLHPMQAHDDERVDIYIERGYANDEPNLFVSINGVNYNLPKGKTSKVPKFVAYEINRSRAAQIALDEAIDQMQAEMAEKAKEIK